MRANLKGSLILILCAFIWGMAFSAQSNAANYIGPFTFVCLRSALTSAVLFGIYPLLRRKNGENATKEARPSKRAAHWKLGCALGVILFAASVFQQLGLSYTTAAKSGFITALYIVLIPFAGLFMGRRVGGRMWCSVAISLTGMALLCLGDDLSINIGDLITLFCAAFFTLHIVVIDKYAANLDSILLNAIQFGMGALLSLPIMLLRETPTLTNILACLPSILYTSILSGAIGYTLQIVGQKYCEPTLASLLMCLEAVFAALGGWMLLGQGLSPRELIGCLLMLGASVIAQLPLRKRALSR